MISVDGEIFVNYTVAQNIYKCQLYEIRLLISSYTSQEKINFSKYMCENPLTN